MLVTVTVTVTVTVAVVVAVTLDNFETPGLAAARKMCERSDQMLRLMWMLTQGLLW